MAALRTGWYTVNFTSGDINANQVAMIFNAANVSGQSVSDPLPLAFVMQKTSGY